MAGFRAWQRMGRVVRRGERAIWILAPVVDRTRGDDEEPSRHVVRGFRHVPVFDVSQTEGEDLPTVCAHLDGEDPHGAYDGLVAAAASLGFTVEDASLPAGVNGDCSHGLRRIRVEAANRPAQRVKTLVHELAHAILQHAESPTGPWPSSRPSRPPMSSARPWASRPAGTASATWRRGRAAAMRPWPASGPRGSGSSRRRAVCWPP